MSAQDCINRIIAAAGRELSNDEIVDIYAKLHKAALDIKAGRSPDGRQMGLDLGEEINAAGGQWQAAAQRAAADMEAEAATVERQANLQILKMGARQDDMRSLVARGMKWVGSLWGQGALDSIFVRNYRGINIESVEQRAEGMKAEFKRQLLPAWDALGSDFLGFFQDTQKLVNLLKEMRGEDSGDPLAKKGAEVWLKVAEDMRQRFNRAGGAIGHLDDWGFPQHHSQERVAFAGHSDDPQANKEAWINAILPLLDRTRYADDLGTPYDDTRMRDFLSHAWASIATNGHANIEPGEFKGTGKRANRHAEERQIHFKDADSVLKYWETFGDKTALEILNAHVDSMAKDIAFIEKLGPNPNLTYQTLRDEALKESTTARPGDTPSLEGKFAKMDANYDYWAGRTVPTYNPTISKIAETITNLNVGGKLGGAALASFFGDKPMMEAVSTLNHLPALQRWSTEVGLLNPMNGDDRRQLQVNGLMLESIRSGLLRFNESLGSSSTTGRLANSVMRVTGMSAINDIRKGSFGISLMATVGNQIKEGKDFSTLHESDIRTLRNYGITEKDWNTWKLAELLPYSHNPDVLTPEGISKITDQQLKDAGIIASDANEEAAHVARQDAIIKLLGAVNTESEFAIVQPGWRERAQFYSKLQRGTFFGEISRAALQFKAFPWAQFQRGLDAVVSSNSMGGKVGMTAWLLLSTTALGAMLMQTRSLLTGQDPEDMTGHQGQNPAMAGKFWARALIAGGALGIYGDLLNSLNQTRMGMGPAELMAGPTLGPLVDLAENGFTYAREKADGKPTHFAGHALTDVKGFLPGGNVWYTRAVVDHIVLQQAMNWLSPGYLSTMQARTMKDYGQGWWWNPGTTEPQRAPNMEKAIGG